MKIDLILFDLGGVLVEWDGIEPLIRISGRPLTAEDARRFWLESPSVRRFETGKCDTEEFAEGIRQELSLRITPETFLECFLSWDRGPKTGAAELLKDLRGLFALGCLSNNNPLHWPRLRDEFQFGGCFDHTFLSHEIGLIKPDPEVFRFVIENLAIPPRRVLFFDDNPECVSAAGNAEMHAFQAGGVGEVRERLADLNLLPPGRPPGAKI